MKKEWIKFYEKEKTGLILYNVFLKESYITLKSNNSKKKWGDSLYNHLELMEHWSDQHYAIGWMNKFKNHIKEELTNNINNIIEKLILVKKTSQKGNNEGIWSDNFSVPQYYSQLHSHILKSITDLMTNSNHVLEIKFNTKTELLEKRLNEIKNFANFKNDMINEVGEFIWYNNRK